MVTDGLATVIPATVSYLDASSGTDHMGALKLGLSWGELASAVGSHSFESRQPLQGAAPAARTNGPTDEMSSGRTVASSEESRAVHHEQHQQARRDVADQRRALHRGHDDRRQHRQRLSTRPSYLTTGQNSLRSLVYFVALAYAVSWGWTFPLAAARSLVEAGVGWPTTLPAVAGRLSPRLRSRHGCRAARMFLPFSPG